MNQDLAIARSRHVAQTSEETWTFGAHASEQCKKRRIAPRRNWKIHRDSARVEWQLPSALIEDEKTLLCRHHRDRHVLDDADDERPGQLATNRDRADLRMRRYTLLERRRIIPHGSCGIDTKACENVVGRDVAHTHDLDTSHAKERQLAGDEARPPRARDEDDRRRRDRRDPEPCPRRIRE